MPDNKLARFLAFLTTDDPLFRFVVLYLPLCSGAGVFLIWWLARGRGVPESLAYGAGVFLLGCFTGLVERALRRRNLR